MSDSLWPHGLQHTRLPCPSLSPGVCSNSCPLSQWCHPIVSSSVTPFFFCLHSFLASRSFPMSWRFASGGQSIGSSALDQSFKWTLCLISFRINWFDLLSVEGTLKSLLQHHNLKASILPGLAFFMVQLLSIDMQINSIFWGHNFSLPSPPSSPILSSIKASLDFI